MILFLKLNIRLPVNKYADVILKRIPAFNLSRGIKTRLVLNFPWLLDITIVA
ncbi:hypothetical protein BgiBS90_020451, partial [Biomphalaria glabrata]